MYYSPEAYGIQHTPPGEMGSAIRIPILGPDPFNTLVVVHVRGVSGLPGIQAWSGDMERHTLRTGTAFVLKGYDPWQPPQFQHSTTGFFRYMASSGPMDFVIGIEGVRGYFSESGVYYIDYDVAFAGDRDDEAMAWQFNLTSWVLVNEPRPESHSDPLTRGIHTRVTDLVTHVASGRWALEPLKDARAKRPPRRGCDE